MEKDLCRFIPREDRPKDLHIFTFSYNSHPDFDGRPVLSSEYGMYLIHSGEGSFHTAGCAGKLRSGSLFFSFPGVPYLIINNGNLSFFSITFDGMWVTELLKSKGIHTDKCLFENCGAMIPFWKEMLISTSKENIHLASQSVFFYTFSRLEIPARKELLSKGDETVLVLKKTADDRYFDSTLSLQAVAKEFNYNPKYLSGLFARQNGIGFCAYLQAIRMDHARELMDTGIQSVREISRMVGYTDAAYFSKSFREVTGMSPRTYIQNISKSNAEKGGRKK